ncbi:MAG: SBBP repeat-containing protein, partial [Verrucomicrobia bacterium]|nr:SBBP repeat-containing protein [Verrucomicrobiota bacterium]
MTIKLRTVLTLGFLLTPIMLLGAPAEKLEESPSNEILQRFDSIPLHFEENRGQLDERVSYVARGLGYQLLLTPEERIMMIYQPEAEQPSFKSGITTRPAMPKTPQAYAIHMQFEGANKNVQLESEGELGSKMHYLRGRDREAWIRNVPTFAKVRYKNLYDGIDVVYYGNQRQVQYDFIIQPGASFETIRMKFDGVQDLSVNASGDLVLGIPEGELIQRRPIIYQEVDGRPFQIEGEFHLIDEETVQFLVKDYDEDLPLIIDPIIEYSKIFGGTGGEVSYGIQVDDTGNVYLTGVTSSFDFPTTQPTGNLADVNYNGGTSDIFVSKVAPDGQSFVWSTFIGGDGQTNGSGGSGQEVAYDLALDASGSVYVVGASASEDFPADVRYYTSAVYEEGDFNPNRHIPIPIDSFTLVGQTDLGFGAGTNSEDAIVFKLTPDGSDFVYSVILGGGSPDGVMVDYGFGIDVDSTGRAYIVGATFPIEPGAESTGTRLYPTTANAFSLQPHFLGGGSFDGFVTVLEPDPLPAFIGDISGVEYSTYVSGGGDDYLYEVAVNDANPADVRIWVTGTSNSFDTDFELSAPFPIIAAPILDSRLDDETLIPFVEDIFLSLSTNPFDGNYNGEFDSFAIEIRPSLAPDMSTAPAEPIIDLPEYSAEDVDDETALNNYAADLNAYATALDNYATALTNFDLGGNFGSPAHFEFLLPDEVPEFSPADINNPTAEELAIEVAEAAANAALTAVQNAWLASFTIHEIVFEEGQVERLNSAEYGTWLGGGPRGTPNGGDGEGGIGDDGLVPLLGGTEFEGNDIGLDIALDSNGLVYIVGSTTSSDFPSSDLAFQTQFGGVVDGWLFKLDSSQADNNDQMIFSTYLAGLGDDVVQSVTVNSDDEAIVTGYTSSENYPVSSNAFDIVSNGGRDVFVTHVSADGSSLEFSTFLGGFNNDEGNKIALNNTFDSERIYITGYTNSLDFLTTVDPLADPADTFYIRGVDALGNTIDIQPELAAGFVTQYDLSLPTPVDNDLFENRRFLGGFSSLIVGNTEAATFDLDEPDHAGVSGGKSVWFSWTSVAVGNVILSTEGSNFDTLLAIYSGPSFANFTNIASNDDKDGSVTWSEVSFPVADGDIFAIAIDGKGGAFGDYQFNLTFETFNDLFSYAQDSSNDLTLLEHHEDSSNVTATREGSEPNHGSASVGKSIWWAWKAPTTG